MKVIAVHATYRALLSLAYLFSLPISYISLQHIYETECVFWYSGDVISCALLMTSVLNFPDPWEHL